ncbi:PfkB family carbohydrate kinase [Prosthecomicrobium sp. N25]|uniref:PfkB family carbohydrate kinase n=1 Tax=Prosthecomicrobium sp. N25 TaxID=3129254 RepID=UPI003077323F
MARIVVVGGVNVDRVHRLARPLVPGGRHGVLSVRLRAGGGGLVTGAVLARMGHAVDLVCRMATDDPGLRAAAVARGLGLRLVSAGAPAGPTRPLDVLVDPQGERTILAPVDAEAEPIEGFEAGGADLVYVNVRRLGPDGVAALAAAPRSVAQVPLEAGERRPAGVLVAGRSDFPDRDVGAIRDLAASCRGVPSGLFVLTDGAGPVGIWEDGVPLESVGPPASVETHDSTGAGDAFAAGLIDALLRGCAPGEAVRAAREVARHFLMERSRFLPEVLPET